MKKQTAGILTFHRALNYGAVLQAYALKAVCDGLGYDTHVIDYSYSEEDGKVAPFSRFFAEKNKKKAAFWLLRSLMSYPGDKKREREFRAFREKYLSESAPCDTAQEVAALGYDALIAGSDQIWNYRITRQQFDPVFFLRMSSPARKVIYAASAHDTPFPLDMERKLKAELECCEAAIGIRERKLADYVAQVTGIRHPVVLDPTLLAGREPLAAIPTPQPPAKPYILLYQIDANPASDISVRTLERRFGCDVYTMTVPRLGSVHGRRGDAGPEKFLSLLKGARFLVTNSFHGIALSLLFEKQFFVYENGGVMSRIDGLLAQVGLTDRKVKLAADIDPEKQIGYALVTPALERLRRESAAFLAQALEGKRFAAAEPAAEPAAPMKLEERRKPDCCGCGACADVCPVGAIRMTADGEGFLYPVIDRKTCIGCGRCDRVCGFRGMPRSETLPRAFGVRHKDLETRLTSRSGAAFVGFSDVILRNGGVVYGAVMQADFTVRHIRATTAEQRDRMKKAKYVQSNTCGIFPQVAQDLRNGQEVLFSGTPCQVAGLKAFLAEKKVDTAGLVCCDMVCHGVPSPAFWEKYLREMERRYHGKVVAAEFRDKDFGWEAHCESFALEGRAEKVAVNEYTDLFYQHIMLRPSCHQCPFANVYRPGDLTMADFWGIEKHDTAFHDNRGVSLVLVNTEKGASVFARACAGFDFFECPVESCMQPTLVKPSAPSPRREQFWEDYESMPFDALLKKYTQPLSLPGKVKRCIKQILYRLGIRKHP